MCDIILLYLGPCSRVVGTSKFIYTPIQPTCAIPFRSSPSVSSVVSCSPPVFDTAHADDPFLVGSEVNLMPQKTFPTSDSWMMIKLSYGMRQDHIVPDCVFCLSSSIIVIRSSYEIDICLGTNDAYIASYREAVSLCGLMAGLSSTRSNHRGVERRRLVLLRFKSGYFYQRSTASAAPHQTSTSGPIM